MLSRYYIYSGTEIDGIIKGENVDVTVLLSKRRNNNGYESRQSSENQLLTECPSRGCPD